MSYYNSIDNCPVAVFEKVLETGDTTLLGIESKGVLLLAWECLYDEYLSVFGCPEKFKEYWILKAEGAVLRAEAVLDNQPHLITFAMIAEDKATKVISSKKGGSFGEMVAIVSKYMGFRVDPKEVTVREFYNYINLLNNG